jgi:hypothetical protein
MHPHITFGGLTIETVPEELKRFIMEVSNIWAICNFFPNDSDKRAVIEIAN